MKKSLLFIIICTFFSSCKHEIVSDDIYGYWQLQNEVEFKGLAFTRLIFSDEDYRSYVDPVINDSIYDYKCVSVKGDSLVLTDVTGKQLILTIKELHDSILVIDDIPGADNDLKFKLIGSMFRENKPINNLRTEPVKSCELPKDSLDVLMKSTEAKEYVQEICKGEPIILTSVQFDKAKYLLRKFIDEKEYLRDSITIDGHVYTNPNNDDVLPYDNYIKQYIGYKKDGENLVFVSIFTYYHELGNPFPYSGIKNYVMFVNDGGPSFAESEINLTTGKVSLRTNGPHDPNICKGVAIKVR